MIKLGDFGLADKLAGADRSSDGERGRLWCGTPCYLSPEEVRDEREPSWERLELCVECRVAASVAGRLPDWRWPDRLQPMCL